MNLDTHDILEEEARDRELTRKHFENHTRERNHTHTYAESTHSNPEWREATVACTVCGFALPKNLLQAALNGGAKWIGGAQCALCIDAPGYHTIPGPDGEVKVCDTCAHEYHKDQAADTDNYDPRQDQRQQNKEDSGGK